MKKLSFIAITLVLTLLLSVAFGTFAAAAENSAELTDEQADIAAAGVIKEFTGAKSDADVVFHSDMSEIMDINSDGKVTVNEAAKALSGYVYAPAKEISDAERIAEDSTYTVTVLEDGRKTVYVLVDIKNNPELLNFSVFADAVKYITDKQNNTALEAGGEFSLMSYEHIAGELALHTIVYALTSATGGEAEGSVFHDYYEQAKDAQLNIDENRAPSWLITLLGQIIAFFKMIFNG